jgi:hypothetical protein
MLILLLLVVQLALRDDIHAWSGSQGQGRTPDLIFSTADTSQSEHSAARVGILLLRFRESLHACACQAINARKLRFRKVLDIWVIPRRSRHSSWGHWRFGGNEHSHFIRPLAIGMVDAVCMVLGWIDGKSKVGRSGDTEI